MEKPKVFIYDWKSKETYKSIFDIAEVETDLQLPNSLNGISLVAFHHYPDNLKEVIKELQKRKIPVIVPFKKHILEFELKKWGIENKGIECTEERTITGDKIRSVLKKYIPN